MGPAQAHPRPRGGAHARLGTKEIDRDKDAPSSYYTQQGLVAVLVGVVCRYFATLAGLSNKLALLDPSDKQSLGFIRGNRT